jgi:hypothetical protein
MPDELLAAPRAEPAKWSAIGQFTATLNHIANLLPYIAQYENDLGHHALRVACTDSFLSDFRAHYSFMLGPRDPRDAHRTDFLQRWKPTRSAGVRRLEQFIRFIHIQRAHFSWERFRDTPHDIEDWVPREYLEKRRLSSRKLAKALSDYLDVVDEFVANLPKDSLEQRAFRTAAFNARYKVNKFLGLPPPL